MDDPNITMEEYIRLEEEKARRHGRTFNWKTATYDKMKYCENEDDSFTNLETEYPTILNNKVQYAVLDTSLYGVDMAPLPHRDLRHPWLRYQVEGYDEGIIHSYEQGFRDDIGLHTEEEMTEARFVAYWQGSERVIPDKGHLRNYWMEISSDRDILGPAPSYVFIRDPVRRLCHRMIACTHYLFRYAEGRKSGARLFEGYFIGHLADYIGLVSDQGLRGLSVVTKRPAAGGPGAAEDAPIVDECAQADSSTNTSPQPHHPLLTHRTMTTEEREARGGESANHEASGRTLSAYDSTLSVAHGSPTRGCQTRQAIPAPP
ncbi:hypothetical protein Tco_1401688 [Tanacetum coccineum]